MLGLCSSMDWKDPSCVTVPSDITRCHGLVTPFLLWLLRTTLALSRNSFICSFVKESSDARRNGAQLKSTAMPRVNRVHFEFIGFSCPYLLGREFAKRTIIRQDFSGEFPGRNSMASIWRGLVAIVLVGLLGGSSLF